MGELLTKLLEHFVTLIENEVLDVLSIQHLVPRESVETSRCGDNDVRALRLVTKKLRVLGDWGSSVEGADPDIRHVLGETRVLVLDLERELPSVAEHQNGHLAVDRLELLKSREDENGGFTVTGLCLAKNIHAENRLRNALLLDWSFA